MANSKKEEELLTAIPSNMFYLNQDKSPTFSAEESYAMAY